MKKAKIVIEGMTCGHCLMAVKKELTAKGIIVETAEIGTAVVSYDEAVVSEAVISEAISEAGFSVVSIEHLP